MREVVGSSPTVPTRSAVYGVRRARYFFARKALQPAGVHFARMAQILPNLPHAGAIFYLHLTITP